MNSSEADQFGKNERGNENSERKGDLFALGGWSQETKTKGCGVSLPTHTDLIQPEGAFTGKTVHSVGFLPEQAASCHL